MKRKKIRNVFLLLIMAVVSLLSITKVNAETDKIKAGSYIQGPYYYMHTKPGHELWEQVSWIVKQSNGDWVYCVQPFTRIKSDATYQVTAQDMAQVASISQANWSMIERIAYYGYGYNENGYNHTDTRWYPATQMLIWQYADPNTQSYFTSSLHGARNDNILRGETNEILALANSHYATPNLNVPSEMVIGNTITVSDSNNVLNKFNIGNVANGRVSKNGNNVSITATNVGNLSFTLSNNVSRFKRNVKLYYATDSQNVVQAGDLDPVRRNYNIKVYGGTITPHKTDVDTMEAKPQGEATLRGAVYGIYKEDGTKVGEITTKEDGTVKSDYLPSLGKFYLQELKPSTGYNLNNEKYYFDITLENLNPEIQVFEEVIKNKFVFTKVYANNKTGIMTPEEGVKFGVYDKDNKLVKGLTTNSDGMISIVLPYGHYTFKQLTTSKDHEKVKDINVNVVENGKTIYKTLANKEITSKLRVVKVDADTKEVIKRKGIKFKIYSYKTNNYVCQRTSYPKAENCVYETDEEGEFITPFELVSGKYKLEEVDQVIDGYTWNKESHDFYIGEDSKLRTDSKYGIIFDTNFPNKRVTGTIEIDKKLEGVELTDKGYVYNTDEVKKGIKYCLYANDDINFNGKTIYKKGDKVKCDETNAEGKITFKDLYLGKYYVIETETLKDYILDNTKHEVELKYKDQYTPVITYKTTLINYLKKGDLEFTKTDFSESETLPNTKIEIYTNDDKLVFSGKTDKDGKIVITKLPEGKYYIVEKEAPKNYLVNTEKMYFEISNGKVTKSKMKDDRLSKLEITKTDVSDGKPVEGATIEVFKINDDGTEVSIYKGITDKDGKIYIDAIDKGKYYFAETNAPEGYQLNTDKHYFEVNEYNKVIKDSLTNTKIVKVPNTEANDKVDLVAGGIVLVLVGAGLVVYNIRRKK